MALDRPQYECRDLMSFLPDLTRVPHFSRYTIVWFSAQLNSAVLSCPLAKPYPEIMALHGNDRS